jgi:hypothetical protein
LSNFPLCMKNEAIIGLPRQARDGDESSC